MKHLFIVNPVAGKYDHTKELRERLEEYRQDFDIEIVSTQGPRDAESIVSRYAASGEPLRVYACGGDGTFNEVAAGSVGLPNVAVTHYPLGSGNDFIKIFSDGGESFHHLDKLLGETDETLFDVIRCNDRIGANICSVGIDARIGTEISKYKRLPLVSGSMAYYISTVVNVVKGIHQHYVVKLDDLELDGEMTLICVANGRNYGSTFNPVPVAEPDDGWLDVLVVRDVSRLKVAQVIGKYSDGHYADYPELISYYRCKTVDITCDKVNSVNIDGELLKTAHVHMELEPKALRVFFPRGLTWSAKKKPEAK